MCVCSHALHEILRAADLPSVWTRKQTEVKIDSNHSTALSLCSRLCLFSFGVYVPLALLTHVHFPSLPGVTRVFPSTGSLRFLILSPATLPISSL